MSTQPPPDNSKSDKDGGMSVFGRRQIDRTISSMSPTTLMALRSMLRFDRPPRWLIFVMIIVTVATWLPIARIVKAKFTKTDQPPLHLFLDMDDQAKYLPQSAAPVFANGMAMRPPVPGAVARGHLEEDDHYYRGYSRQVDPGSGEQTVEFFDSFPEQVTVDAELLARGKEMYARYCYLCHGYDGYGNGPIHVRASRVAGQNPTWVQPSNLHDEARRSRPVGHLYNTINNGIRSMAGYGHQIPVEDRWAIVAYIRALQLSQNASPDLVPTEIRDQMEVRGPSVNQAYMEIVPPQPDQAATDADSRTPDADD